MRYLDLTLPTPPANLRCDEALLEQCGKAGGREVLRIWEASVPFVVVGYSNRNFDGVRLDACRKQGIPAFRRHSGGGTVLQAPGCLNYAVVIKTQPRGPMSSIRGTNRFVMERNRRAVMRVLGAEVEINGFTDLTINGRKFSGSAQYRRRHAVLFHGTFLLDLDIELVEELIEIPSVAPEYRQGRSHTDFLTNLGVSAASVKDSLREEWEACSEMDGFSVAGIDPARVSL